MKKINLLVGLIAIFCIISGCSNASSITGLKSELMEGGPAIVCHNKKIMNVTFANPTTAAWILDIDNSVIDHETFGTVKLVWEQNQYQKGHGALGFTVYRADKKPFKPGHYTFKMLLIKENKERVYEGEFNLQYKAVIPLVMP